MRARLIVNRCARHLRNEGPLLAALRRPRAGITVVESTSLDDLGRIAAQVDEEAVVIAGGDGSYMAGLSALARTRETLPAIALAPGGTVSTVAKNWGLRGDPARYTDALLDAIAAGTATRTMRPTLQVEDGAATRTGFIVGSGLVARFFEEYLAAGAGGTRAAARIVARVFAGSFVGGALARRVLEPMRCRVTTDAGEAPFDRVSLVCASVVRDLGLGMRLLYRAAEEPDRFHAVATPLGPFRLGPQMPLVLAGRPLKGPRVDALTSRLELVFPGGTGAYVLDGDLFRADRVVVTAGPSFMQLGTPHRRA